MCCQLNVCTFQIPLGYSHAFGMIFGHSYPYTIISQWTCRVLTLALSSVSVLKIESHEGVGKQ